MNIAPAMALAALHPEALANQTELQKLVIPQLLELWLRGEQQIPAQGWQSWTYIGGRGQGKTHAVASFMNREIREGHVKWPGLMAPSDDRVRDVQVKSLIESAPPWFRPEEYRGSIVWPNGVFAEAFSAEAPGAPRGSNLDLSWMTEIVSWPASTQVEAYQNLTTATRRAGARTIADTTSKGKNKVIQMLIAQALADPANNVLIRGSLFDNPLLSLPYIRATVAQYSGRRYEEEINGAVFAESAEALWMQDWFNAARVAAPPTNIELRLAAVDPGLSTREDSDPTGIVVGSRKTRPDGKLECYWERDESGRYRPEEWGDIVVSACVDGGAAGVILERNHSGDNPEYVVRTRAAERGCKVKILDRGARFPARTPGVIYVREVIATRGKSSRASGPAAATKAGLVHVCGVLENLETECTTWEPEASKSPNALDAAAYLTIELLGLDSENGGRPPVIESPAATLANKRLDRLLSIGDKRRI